MKKKEIEENIQKRAIVKANQGKIRNIAFVFSCPGKEEVQARKVLFGTTGKNLNIILKYLIQHDSNLFASEDRYDYFLTNSSERVYFKGYLNSKRTEAYSLDINSSQNINRLTEELKDKNLIVSFGKKARSVVGKIKIEGRKIFVRHLGQKSLNQINKSIDGNEIAKDDSMATKKRLQVVANEIIKQL